MQQSITPNLHKPSLIKPSSLTTPHQGMTHRAFVFSPPPLNEDDEVKRLANGDFNKSYNRFSHLLQFSKSENAETTAATVRKADVMNVARNEALERIREKIKMKAG